jgi:hypothetical protein
MEKKQANIASGFILNSENDNLRSDLTGISLLQIIYISASKIFGMKKYSNDINIPFATL